MSYLSAKVYVQIDAPELTPSEILEKLQWGLSEMCHTIDKEIVHCFVTYRLGDTLSTYHVEVIKDGPTS